MKRITTSIVAMIVAAACSAQAGTSASKPASACESGLMGRAKGVAQDTADVAVATVQLPIQVVGGLTGQASLADVPKSVVALTGSVGDLASSATLLATEPVEMINDAAVGAGEKVAGKAGGMAAGMAVSPVKLPSDSARAGVGVVSNVLNLRSPLAGVKSPISLPKSPKAAAGTAAEAGTTAAQKELTASAAPADLTITKTAKTVQRPASSRSFSGKRR